MSRALVVISVADDTSPAFDCQLLPPTEGLIPAQLRNAAPRHFLREHLDLELTSL